MMGIFSKRMNRPGAVCGMLAGLGSTLVYIFLYKGWFFVASTALLADNPDGWMMGISPGSFGAVGAMINFAVAFTVSSMTTPPPKEITEMVDNFRVPMGAGGASDH
jgi:cation/acetate symporter